jgi:hypothetical protein
MERFSSLDSDSDRISEIGEKGDSGGASPLDPNGFEDPGTWAGELGGKGQDTPVPQEKAGSAWLESGRISSTGNIPIPKLSAPPALVLEENEDPSLARMLEGEARARYTPEQKRVGKRGYMLAVLAGLTAGLVIVVLAYVLGWIP